MSSVIDDYEPLEVIGNGSFGVIRKVKRRSDGQLFARKELNFERMTDRDRKQIVAEVNILKDLKHENIVRYINRYVDQENKMLYILMEYCGGGDLASLISTARRQSRPLPEDQIWNYFVQILLALHHCHFPNIPPHAVDSSSIVPDINTGHQRQQILHRDLKPENVFLSTDNCIKLGDFGLSKQLASASFASTYVGTPYYMSPELMSEKAYDNKSDIWSLGCLVYELCALNAPFHDAQTYNELANSIRSGRIPPIPKGYSTALNNVIKSMLNINPAMRPSTQQLLKVEQLSFAYKLVEVNKMISDVRARREALSSREKAVTAREQVMHEREAGGGALQKELMERVAEYTAERAQFDAKRAQLDAERAQLDAERAQFDAERITLEKTSTELARVRAEFDGEVEVARDAYHKFTEDRDAFNAEKARWEKEVLAKMTKPPLDDVKNKVLGKSYRYASNSDETPSKVANEAPLYASHYQGEETPSKVSISGNGVVFPAMGVAAPAAATRAIQRLRPQTQQTLPPFPSLPSQQHETPRRLASKSMTDLGSAMKGVILTDSGTILPTPVKANRDVEPMAGGSCEPRPAFASDVPVVGAASEGEASGSRSVRSEVSPYTLASNVDASHVTARHRVTRRRSILPPAGGSARPPLPASATTSLIPRIPSAAAASTSTAAPTSASGFTMALPPAPVWDLADEENLPSPFVKRNVDFSAYIMDKASLSSFPTSASGSSIRSIGLGGTVKGRPSLISRAVKASGEAQKALARRQAEGKLSA